MRIRHDCFVPATPRRSEPLNTAQFSPRMQRGFGRAGDCGQIPDRIDQEAPWSDAALSGKYPAVVSFCCRPAADRDRAHQLKSRAHQLKSIEPDKTDWRTT